MKTTLLILIAVLFASCTAEETEYMGQTYNPNCGTIRAYGIEGGQHYILVQEGNETVNNFDKYQCDSSYRYKVGNQICDFSGLTKMPY